MADIELTHVDLNYPSLGPGDKSARTLIARSLRALRRPRSDRTSPGFQALRAISLTAAAGDRIALIGANGSGKSSLLRLLAGIHRPSRGTLRIRGQVGTLFDIGYGMDGDLLGRDFAVDRCLFKGLDRAAIDATLPEIRAFSGLGPFFDQPLRTYSDGMRVRLAFSVSTMISPDILLIDEIFGAGDHHFFGPACARILSQVGTSGITIFSTHWLELAEGFCNRAVWLDKGRVRQDGSVSDVFDAYRNQRTAP